MYLFLQEHYQLAQEFMDYQLPDKNETPESVCASTAVLLPTTE